MFLYEDNNIMTSGFQYKFMHTVSKIGQQLNASTNLQTVNIYRLEVSESGTSSPGNNDFDREFSLKTTVSACMGLSAIQNLSGSMN